MSKIRDVYTNSIYVPAKMDVINKLESCYCFNMCFIGINFNQILISFDDNIIYENIESVFLVICSQLFL